MATANAVATATNNAYATATFVEMSNYCFVGWLEGLTNSSCDIITVSIPNQEIKYLKLFHLSYF